MSDAVAAAPPVALDDVVDRYVKLRDKKAEMDAAHKLALEPINAAMDRCETYLLATLKGMGVESVRTSAGTAFTKTAVSVTVANWPALLDFIKTKNMWSMLKRDVTKSVVQEYREEHNDLPPGVSWSEARVVNIRRA